MKLKYFTSLLLIASFIAIAVFSFTIFDHHMNHAGGSSSGCLAYALDGVACPTSIITSALRYVSSVFNLFFALPFLLLASILIFRAFKDWWLVELITNYSQRGFTRWLALLENSPSK